MQKYARAVRDEFKDEFDYVEEQVKVVRGEITEARGAVQEQSKAFSAEMKAMNDGLKSDMKTDLPPLFPPLTRTKRLRAPPRPNPPLRLHHPHRRCLPGAASLPWCSDHAHHQDLAGVATHFQ